MPRVKKVFPKVQCRCGAWFTPKSNFNRHCSRVCCKQEIKEKYAEIRKTKPDIIDPCASEGCTKKVYRWRAISATLKQRFCSQECTRSWKMLGELKPIKLHNRAMPPYCRKSGACKEYGPCSDKLLLGQPIPHDSGANCFDGKTAVDYMVRGNDLLGQIYESGCK